LNGTYVLPATLQAASSLAGPFLTTDFVDFSSRSFTVIGTGAKKNIPWSAAGIQNNDARQAFALNTCGGCHRAETAINFIHVGFPVGNSLPTRLGKPAALSGFLTGKSIADPVVGSTTRVFGDLQRRQQDFSDLIDNGARGRHWPTFVH
jgi:hypothetical protein